MTRGEILEKARKDREDIAELYNTGVSVSEIAKIYGVTPYSIYFKLNSCPSYTPRKEWPDYFRREWDKARSLLLREGR